MLTRCFCNRATGVPGRAPGHRHARRALGHFGRTKFGPHWHLGSAQPCPWRQPRNFHHRNTGSSESTTRVRTYVQVVTYLRRMLRAGKNVYCEPGILCLKYINRETFSCLKTSFCCTNAWNSYGWKVFRLKSLHDAWLHLLLIAFAGVALNLVSHTLLE